MQNISCECRTGRSATGIKISGRNINNLRYAVDTTLIAESKEELNSLLNKVKEESEKAGLKLNLQKTKVMEICLKVKKQQLELDMEQQISSKLRKGYVKAIVTLLI